MDNIILLPRFADPASMKIHVDLFDSTAPADGGAVTSQSVGNPRRTAKTEAALEAGGG